MTTFGIIELLERTFINEGKLLRPFELSAKVYCRGYSLPLQRVITDFGSDVSFAHAVAKINEHYNIDVPVSAIRLITEKHAHRIRESDYITQKFSASAVVPDYIIAETDGTMVPIVTINDDIKGDRRKTRRTEWNEARLALARRKGSRDPVYAACIGSTDEAGEQLANVVAAAGRHKKTRIHGVGDGAPWIADQFDKQFGSDSNYLIDFYHLSDYLNEAALCCNREDSLGWLREQQALMKENRHNVVLQKLEAHINDPEPKEHVCGAAKCYQYMEKRIKNLNYKDAIAQELPIGSGEVESGHRFVIQKRLKTPGAWWLKKNANDMLALRATRANGNWNAYWPSPSAREWVN